jgi:hypothetical protein
MSFKEFIRDANETFQLLETTGKALSLFVELYIENDMKDDSNRTKLYFLSTPAKIFVEKGIDGVAEYCRKEASDGKKENKI